MPTNRGQALLIPAKGNEGVTPLTVFGSALAAWYKADAISGLNDGDAISTWADQSGNGRDATQASTKRPTYKVNILNGKPAVRFNGSQGMLTSSFDLSSSAATIIVVATAGASGNQMLVEFATGATGINGASGGLMLIRNVTTLFPQMSSKTNGSLASHVSDVALTSTAKMVAGVGDTSRPANEADVYIDGIMSATARTNNNNTTAYASLPLALGARDPNGTLSLGLNGDLYEIILVKRAATQVELGQIGAYLNTRWGVKYGINFHLGPSDFADDTEGVQTATYVRTSTLARARFTSDAVRMHVAAVQQTYATYPTLTDIGVRKNNADTADLQAPADMAFQLGAAPAAGSGQIIEVINGLRVNPSGTILGVYATDVTFPHDSNTTLMARPANTNRITLYGDSITSGADDSDPPRHSWAAQVRAARYAQNGSPVNLVAWGSRALYDDANTSQLRAALVAEIALLSPSIVWLAIGTNDYGISGGKWSAASFGTAYAALLDDLHTALPSAAIYCAAPIARIAPASEAANSFGSTLGDYRTQISNAAAARPSYATYADATSWVSAGNMNTDGIHPLAAGHTEYATQVKATLGIP